ncbi:hypothetical protein OSH11_13755 [Kaistia dalseonensis]|uniref:Uncharacterized protein n=1 Tax=Kaistia dalseonensis TaxID=410840 RepID=A0ABU0HA55_9HYPH|nr:hypothetical protein [Kaistia dalseonensis]MCX5495774.1 hypothetical protein [Kaistia dalseonensis]MDQ0438374.1 hypothetical protein [Kaistia dalseonensis]
MTGFYWGFGTRLKTFSQSSRGTGPVSLKIELEVTDTNELAYLLKSLGDAQREQDAATRPADPRAKDRPSPSDPRPRSADPVDAHLARIEARAQRRLENGRPTPLLIGYREK